MLAVGLQIVRTEGILGLYKGLTPSILKAAPSSAITFFVFSLCQRWFFSRKRKEIKKKME
jgi:solute carrier family 25 thiamine pyrophosphate transporter 19